MKKVATLILNRNLPEVTDRLYDHIEKYDGEFPKKYFKEILNYIDISEEEFWKRINIARSEHLWEFVDKRWKLKHIVS